MSQRGISDDVRDDVSGAPVCNPRVAPPCVTLAHSPNSNPNPNSNPSP